MAASPSRIIEAYIESPAPASIERLHRDLATHMHDSYLENNQGLKDLFVCAQIASVLLVVEVVLWIVAIAFAS